MGKSLNDKELGKGISQRQDGYYVARYTDITNKRIQKVFQDLNECRKWLKDELDYKERSDLNVPSQIDFDTWFEYWTNIKKRTVRESTMRVYNIRYTCNIHPFIGKKRLRDVTNMDCQRIVASMAEKRYSNSTISLTKQLLHGILEYAYVSDIIPKNPCNKLIKSNIGEQAVERLPMTVKEQKEFCNAIKGTRYELDFRFALQTGLRAGELSGLKWKDVDWDNRMLNVERSVNVINCELIVGEPKSKSGHRKIPLTEEAVEILQEQKKKDLYLRTIDSTWGEYIFLSKMGKPVRGNAYNGCLRTVCNREQIERVTMHILRHTFATRCIEAGMLPKTLQTILGHSEITMTMDRYVHTTDEQSTREMNMVSNFLVV